MPTDVIMPQMGESIFEGTITKWLKQAGDPVEKDEPLFEISTDKVDAEIPSPIAGVLTEIRFPAGATVQVNAVVAVLSENGLGGALSRQAKAAAGTKDRASAPDPGSTKDKPQAAPASGAIDIVMPQMGESIFEGTILKWLRHPGDRVEKDEPLFEISTDKVDAEIPSLVDGVLAEIKYPEGATVQVNEVVARVSTDAAGVGAPAPKTRSQAASAGPQVIPPAPEPGRTPSPGTREANQSPRRSSPLVRRIAKEHGIDLAGVSGTGSSGRITKEDILGHLGRDEAMTQASSGARTPASSPSPAKAQPLRDELVPLSKMRALIAERMAESKRAIPHAHTVYKVDMTRVVRLRDRERAVFEQRHGFKLTYMPFIAMAAIDALGQYPIVNASLAEGGIRYHGNIHLGIAVALEWGLIVPVVRAAETRDFLALARAINDLASRARGKKLMPDEVGGSTFTLTNPGVFGGEYGMPIINQPESAILAIGGLRKEPVVLTDPEGNDTIAIRSVQYYCLGFDHRLIDGADSGKFMTAFKASLETWDRPIA